MPLTTPAHLVQLEPTMKPILAAAAALLVAMSSALAQNKSDDHSSHHSAAATKDAGLADGEVRKVDKDSAKITIRHGEIKALGMPPMTMVFGVKDKALLEKVKAGDKIRFVAIDEGGRYTFTDIRVQR
jgi:Cu/Ag efflux protein CusF